VALVLLTTLVFMDLSIPRLIQYQLWAGLYQPPAPVGEYVQFYPGRAGRGGAGF